MFELTQHEHHPFLVLRHHGRVCVAEINEAREALSQRCKEAQIHRVLIDLREAVLDVSMRDALALAESAVPSTPTLKRAAMLRSQEQLVRDEVLAYYELSAKNRGHNVQLFRDAAAAEEWLLE